MSFKNDAFPSSTTFDQISQLLQTSPSARADALKQGAAIFAITLKNPAGETASWHLDLKNEGTVGHGVADANVTLTLSDADFAKLVAGKANAQRLFMGGKLKVKGDVMKAARLEGILGKVRAQGEGKVKAKL